MARGEGEREGGRDPSSPEPRTGQWRRRRRPRGQGEGEGRGPVSNPALPQPRTTPHPRLPGALIVFPRLEMRMEQGGQQVPPPSPNPAVFCVSLLLLNVGFKRIKIIIIFIKTRLPECESASHLRFCSRFHCVARGWEKKSRRRRHFFFFALLRVVSLPLRHMLKARRKKPIGSIYWMSGDAGGAPL